MTVQEMLTTLADSATKYLMEMNESGASARTTLVWRMLETEELVRADLNISVVSTGTIGSNPTSCACACKPSKLTEASE
jgi:hypothetical protein